MAKNRTAAAKAAGPAASAAPTRSLKVVAIQTGFYPSGIRRRKGSVFTLTDPKHYSDSTKERVVRGIRTGLVGWMLWVDPQTPERQITQEEEAQSKLHEQVAASAGSASDADVI
jgi:hypothetical protein